jgi:polyisoprenoid-binding protein YceI
VSKIIFIFISFLITTKVQNSKYLPVDESKSVQFVIQNFGFDVKGTFNGLTGLIEFDENNLSNASFQASVNTATINTNNNTRDKHLKGADYFDVLKYPTIKISSTKISKSATPGYYVFFGTLSMKGKSSDIVFPFKFTTEKQGVRFTGDFKIKRKDFNVGGNSTVSNELIVKLNVLAKKT